ncbi:MAG: type II secretion system F family protein [Deltaproteobacteria bacterium]|nr:type II secretion system F family protein [Deltaproteobacteria bacterium]
MQIAILRLCAIAAFVIASATIAYWIATIEPEVTPTLGIRGESRRRALERKGLFYTLEALIRVVAGWFKKIPFERLRFKLETELKTTGYYLGLTPDEYCACVVLSTLAFGAVGAGVGLYFESTVLGSWIGCFFGFFAQTQQLRNERFRRYKEVDRNLPGDIDLAAMCMSAGLDFPGALRLLVEQNSGKGKGSVLREELKRVLQELELGQTRAAALRNLESRVPTEAVREFVGAVVQAEEKGTPLAEILKIQATMLRMRRSIAAEEAASRAGVLMMIPLMMLLGCILIILMGSMLIETYESGMF